MLRKNIHFIKYWLPAILWYSVIFTISSIPNLQANQKLFPFSDKIGHFLEYFILGLLLKRALTNSNYNFLKEKAIHLSIFLATIYAVSDEIHQIFVPQRKFEILDIVVDIIGAVCGQILI
jgi:VanZ family protein